jgi:hypothetical protein
LVLDTVRQHHKGTPLMCFNTPVPRGHAASEGTWHLSRKATKSFAQRHGDRIG